MYKHKTDEDKSFDSQEASNTTKKCQNKEYSSMEDFQVLKKIGEGTYSTVFKVRRLADDQIYALKKIKLDNMGKKDQESALNEVRILASISHQNIIAYRETFYEKGCLFLVLQFAENGDLLHEINQKKKEKLHFSEIQIWQVLLQISLALHTLHSQKIIHRDIKPANIFLTKQGMAKLGDLNVSKIINKFCQTQAGTPYYASPQIWKDEPYDKKSDIWSLGCTMYQMATFSPPFVGQDLQTIYNSIIKNSFSPLPLYYSKQLHKLIGRMLQKQPKRRPSAQYILRNIQRIIPEVYKNLSIIQKVKGLFFRTQNKNTSSFQLLKTIMFPTRKDRRYNQLYANSYLPSPSYSRDHTIDQLNDLNSSIASATVNLGVKNQQGKQKKSKIKKGSSLHAHDNRDKQNAQNCFKKNKESIYKVKDNRLPFIKKKAVKK